MKSILDQYNSQIIAKASKIRALVFDVDGVLTNGQIIYSNSGEETKSFDVKDGQIIKFLKKNKIVVGAITGRKSELVKRRCDELNLDFCHQGIKDKFKLLNTIIDSLELDLSQVAYVGDDIIDLKCIINSGLGVVPRDGVNYVKEKADLVANADGGRGVVREVADFILAAQGLLDDIVEEYCK